MDENFDHFMVFELLDSGERRQLDLTEQEFIEKRGNGLLHPKQVVLIVKEDLRRIYIWKGRDSTVRKKFIASRVASELQNELMRFANFHRCKIVSVDQDEEPTEFLNAFGFKRDYLSNIDANMEVIRIKRKEIKGGRTLQSSDLTPEKKFPVQEKNRVISQKTSKHSKLIFKQEQDNVPTQVKQKKDNNIYIMDNLGQNFVERKMKEILNLKIPENFSRKAIISCKGIVFEEIVRKGEIFGEEIIEKSWEPIKNLSKDIFELEGSKLRIHYNKSTGLIEAIEVLEKKKLKKESKDKVEKRPLKESTIDYSKWTVKQLKAFCSKHGIKVPSSYRKADIIRLVKENVQNSL